MYWNYVLDWVIDMDTQLKNYRRVGMGIRLGQSCLNIGKIIIWCYLCLGIGYW